MRMLQTRCSQPLSLHYALLLRFNCSYAVEHYVYSPATIITSWVNWEVINAHIIERPVPVTWWLHTVPLTKLAVLFGHMYTGLCVCVRERHTHKSWNVVLQSIQYSVASNCNWSFSVLYMQVFIYCSEICRKILQRSVIVSFFRIHIRSQLFFFFINHDSFVAAKICFKTSLEGQSDRTGFIVIIPIDFYKSFDKNLNYFINHLRKKSHKAINNKWEVQDSRSVYCKWQY